MLTSHAAPTRTALRGRAGRLRGVGSWIVFGLVVVLAVLLWPHQWGGRTSLTIVSGHSMDGTYSTGDLVVGRVGTAEVGDVVVFRPPGLDGYDPNFKNPWKEFNLEKAKEYLAKAGYPDGKGLPPLQYSTTSSSTARQTAEYFEQQFAPLGIKVVVSAK